jgi:hypothetical protein
MIEVPNQVHDVVAQLRAEMAATRHALNEGVDATRHAVDVMSNAVDVLTNEADHFKHAAVQAAVKATDAGQQAFGSAASQLKATTPRQRALVPILVAVVASLGIVMFIRAKRRRKSTEEPLEWEPTE